ncbi:MAG TPA: hypothetical protein VFR76_08155, partial [Verrucomicrobiae bacterium]|nr:hypothetical protein [Verrucomicrobiae bacterium]
MAWQLIYTSALRTLVPGQSGYGTVARSTDLREALIQRLEQLSYYQHIAGLGASTTVQSHVVSAYRILDFRGSRYHVLSRIQDAGLDFTSRTNHLAHHLVFEPAERGGIAPPAVILSQWNGWRNRWEEGPRLLEEADWGDLRTLPRGVSLPAATWQAITGDAGSAAALLVRPYAAGCNLLCQPGEEATLLNLFAESLQLLDPDCRHPVKLWEHTFTTYFQAEDSPADFLWRGCVEGTPGWQAVKRKADASLVPLRGVNAPENQLAKLAREGRPQIVVPARSGPAPAGVSPASSPSPLRLESRSSAWRKPPVSAPPSTSHPVVRPRTVTLNFTSPRFWLPALVLLVVAAFGLPRYLKSRAGGDVRRVESPTNSLLAAGGPGSTRSGISRPSNPKRDRSKAADDHASPRLREALRQLEAQTSAVPTWVLALDRDAAVPVRIGELEALLGKVFRDDQALTTNSIECRITVRSCEFSQTTGTIAVVTVDPYGKKLRVRIPPDTGFDLNCDDWFNDRMGVQPVQF